MPTCTKMGEATQAIVTRASMGNTEVAAYIVYADDEKCLLLIIQVKTRTRTMVIMYTEGQRSKILLPSETCMQY